MSYTCAGQSCRIMDCVTYSETEGKIYSSQSFARKLTEWLSASVLLDEQLKRVYEDFHLFILLWVTDLEKPSLC